MSNQLKPTNLAPDVVTLTPMQDAKPLDDNVITAIALDISQLNAGDCPNRHSTDTSNRSLRDMRGRFCRSSSCWHSSRSPRRGRQFCRSLSCRSISSSCSPSQDCRSQRRSPHHGRRSSTLYRHQISNFKSSTPSQMDEVKLYTNRASDGHRAFHTTLQLVTKQGCKPLPIKVAPRADVNTIPLS